MTCEATRPTPTGPQLIHDAPARLYRFRCHNVWEYAVCQRHQRLRCGCGAVMQGVAL